MATFRAAAVAASFALLFASPARAETCSSLRSELEYNTASGWDIAIRFPKTHLALFACFAGSETQDDAAGCAAAVIVTACLWMGSEDCGDLTYRWGKAAFNYQSITTRMRRLGCRM